MLRPMSTILPPPRLPAPLAIPLDLATLLAEAAVESIRRKIKKSARDRRPRRGHTIKPGTDTPLWNELAATVRAQCVRRGEKAKLARILGLPRQRLHEFLRERRALPDAERTLLMLVWLQARREGRDL
eukprot:gene18950-23212_t